MSEQRRAGSSTNVSTGKWGVEKLVIGAVTANVATPASVGCRLVHVIVPSGNTGNVTVQATAEGAADANDPVLPEDYTNVFPVCDPSLLTFYSGTDTDVVHILWFD